MDRNSFKAMITTIAQTASVSNNLRAVVANELSDLAGDALFEMLDSLQDGTADISDAMELYDSFAGDSAAVAEEAPSSEVKKYDLVLLEKPGEDGLTPADIMSLLPCCRGSYLFPVEFEAREHESTAIGFMSDWMARALEYDYERSGLHDFIAVILDDMRLENENGEYSFGPFSVWLGR